MRQNLVLHAQLFDVPAADIPSASRKCWSALAWREERCAARQAAAGLRQRLSLAVAMVHKPELLILDEPTSGVDPIARDQFWRLLVELSRRDQVTIFISTHFMNEAERCDRMSMMHAGKVLDSDAPAAVVAGARRRHAGGSLHRLSGEARRRRAGRPIGYDAYPAGARLRRLQSKHRAPRASARSACGAICGAKAGAAARPGARRAGPGGPAGADDRDRLRHQHGMWRT